MTPADQSGPHEALTALRGAAPASAVVDRIVAGATAQDRPGRRPWLTRGAIGLAAAAAGLAIWALAPAPANDLLTVGPHRVTRAETAEVEVTRHTRDDTLVRLARGEARFDVAPLGPGEAFRVQTPELEVEVVGTAFTVHSAESCSTVAVTEGKVRVSAGRASRLLAAGERMRHCAAAAEHAAPGEALIREAQRHLLDPTGAPDAIERFERYTAEHPDGVFLEEALFHLAFAHRAAGDEAAAAAAAARFVERFPRSRRAARLRAAFELDLP